MVMMMEETTPRINTRWYQTGNLGNDDMHSMTGNLGNDDMQGMSGNSGPYSFVPLVRNEDEKKMARKGKNEIDASPSSSVLNISSVSDELMGGQGNDLNSSEISMDQGNLNASQISETGTDEPMV